MVELSPAKSANTNDAEQSKKPPPRKHRTMYLLLAWLLIFSLTGLATATQWLSFFTISQNVIVIALGYSFAAGGIGASMYGIRMLYYHSHLKDDGNLDDGNLIDSYFFCWDKIIQDDKNEQERLKKFLKKNFCVSWVDKANIEKPDDRTISISYEDKQISLRLNDEKTRSILTIDNVGVDAFIAKKEDGKLNIYKDDIEKEFAWNWGWFWFYFNRPIMGAFVGLIAVVLIQGGLLTLSGTNPNPNTSTNIFLFAIGLGWLAGYNVTDLILRLEKVATSLFGLEHEDSPFERLKKLAHSRGIKEGRK